MGGTVKGGIKTAITNRVKYGDTFYSDIGKLSHDGWVKNGKKPRGFSTNHDLAVSAGKKSKRGAKKLRLQIPVNYMASLTFPAISYERIGWLERLRRRFNDGK